MKALLGTVIIVVVAMCGYIVGQKEVGRYNVTYVGEYEGSFTMGAGTQTPTEIKTKTRQVLMMDTKKGQVRACVAREKAPFLRCGKWEDVVSNN